MNKYILCFFTLIILVSMGQAQGLQPSFGLLEQGEAESGRLESTLTPTDTLDPGIYSSPKGYFHSMEIDSWADEYHLSALLRYGDYLFEATALVDWDRKNRFYGKGKILVNFTNGTVCSYPFSIRIKAYEQGLFVRSAQPSSIPTKITDESDCFLAGATETYIHVKPYVLKD